MLTAGDTEQSNPDWIMFVFKANHNYVFIFFMEKVIEKQKYPEPTHKCRVILRPQVALDWVKVRVLIAQERSQSEVSHGQRK